MSDTTNAVVETSESKMTVAKSFAKKHWKKIAIGGATVAAAGAAAYAVLKSKEPIFEDYDLVTDGEDLFIAESSDTSSNE